MIDGGTIIRSLKNNKKEYTDSCVTYSNPMLNDILDEACDVIDYSGPWGALDWTIVICLLLV